jgi:hypothetical protein
MKHLPGFLVRVSCSALGLLAAAAYAETLAVNSPDIASGGGASSGSGPAGAFSLTSSIAQVDAAPVSTGGPYQLRGGFFAHYEALQVAGAPKLRLRPGPPNGIEVVWASSTSTSWVLQYNISNLASNGWTDVPQTPVVEGEDQVLSFDTPSTRIFFRLRKR